MPHRLGLYDLGNGWQRVGVAPFYDEVLRLGTGVEEVVAATRAPALAAWVSESVCVHLEGRAPSGLAYSMHLPNTDEDCGYQHLEGRPGYVDPQRVVDAMQAWSAEAGLTPSAPIVSDTWDESPFSEDAVLALFAALGLPHETEIQPVVDPTDRAFGDYWKHAGRAEMRASELVHAARNGYVLGPEFDLTPQQQDYLRFRDLVWGSVYGGGLGRDELIAEYERLTSRWPGQ
jgi:hypothetical protein